MLKASKVKPIVVPSPSQRAKSDYQLFNSFSDSDFFSDKLTHVYFYDRINWTTINALKEQINKVSEPITVNGIIMNPKPILLHINSPGGEVAAGLSSMSIFTGCKVPIAVMVDGLSASAATFLSIYAAYRVATPLSTCLIHEAYGWISGKQSDQDFHIKYLSQSIKYIRNMYLKKTKIPKKELKDLMRRDLLIDAKKAMQYGIYDRIIDLGKNRKMHIDKYITQHPDLNLPVTILLKKGNLNHINLKCNQINNNPYLGVKETIEKIDKIIFQDNTDVRPVIFHSTPNTCTERVYSQFFPLVSKISALRVPSIGVVDTMTTLYDILPILNCNRRIMYDSGKLLIHIMYHVDMNMIFADIVDNTMLVLNKIKELLRQKTKMPDRIIDNLEKKRYILSAKKCLKYRIIDEIIPLL